MHALVLIKKRRYWPKGVLGDAIDQKLRDASISETVAIRGSINNIEYHLFLIKDKDHIMELLTTCSSLSVGNNVIESVRHDVNNTNPNQHNTLTITANAAMK